MNTTSNTTAQANNGITILGAADSYSLFNASGHIERNTRVKLAKGVKIYAVGYAGITQHMAIYDDNMNAVEIYTGTADPATVDEYEADPENSSYFGELVHVDELARPWSQRHGIGYYYDESGEMVSDEVIERSLIHARAVKEAQAATVKAREEAFAAKQDEMRRTYGHILTEPTQPRYTKDGAKELKKNITTLIRHYFPGLKFTIRKDWRGYTVVWTDGPTADEMLKVAGLFEESCSRDRYNDDLFEHSDTAFTSVFGGVENINTDRTISDELTATAAAQVEAAINNPQYVGSDADKVEMYARELGAHCREITGHKREYWANALAKYISAYTKPQEPQKAPKPTKEKPTPKVDGLTLVDYSEKAIALIGDTKSIKEQLKAIGGRFNARLSCGAGWIFSKKKENELKALLAL